LKIISTGFCNIYSMAKVEKKATARKKRGKYDEKLQVKEGSFLEIIQASMKHVNEHSAKKKKATE